MRKLRLQRQLSLQQASVPLNTSAPVLSRKERGEDEIERMDIRLAIAAYRLTAWDAYELWTAAGFMPEPTVPSPDTYDLRELAETLLPDLPFPAFILDILGYLKAWNQGIEAIWSPSLAQTKPIHILADLFSTRLRQFVGECWDSYVLLAIQVFYHKTLRVANDPAFRELLDRLCREQGEEFIRKWNEAQSANRSQEGPNLDRHAAERQS